MRFEQHAFGFGDDFFHFAFNIKGISKSWLIFDKSQLKNFTRESLKSILFSYRDNFKGFSNCRFFKGKLRFFFPKPYLHFQHPNEGFGDISLKKKKKKNREILAKMRDKFVYYNVFLL